ncbi:unnamed protein product [Pelagomonas calceolata]|uniref:Uncharacterized protein n=1 Tax=Pelagomonas calceolata TaxID=35677 RepID=A0A8J2T0Y3_9STRA|nr:unnamed protein product [Pelagomonas calceolata]
MAERNPSTPTRRVRISSASPTRSPVRLTTPPRTRAGKRSPYASPARSPYRSPPTTPRGSAAVTVLGKRVPRVSLPILWWLQARTRAAVLEKRLKNMPREDPSEATALRARVAALEEAVRQAELHAARQTARATEAEAKAARLIEAPPAYDTAEGERILKERLDELRRGTLDALRAAEAKNERLAAENAAATQELAECRRKLAMDHVEAESKLAAELDRLTAETRTTTSRAAWAGLRDNRQPLLETAAIYAARRRPFSGKSVEEPAVDINEPVRRILDVATRRQQLLPTIAPLVEERDARATTGCDAALGAVMAVAAQRNEARLIQAQQRLEALATAAERAAAGASGAVGAIAHPDIQQTIADEKESRRTAAVSEFRAQRRAVDAELADLRTTRARAVDSLRKERADRAKTDTAREAALAAAASASSRLTARRVAKAVRETEDRAFSAHALALEDAATAQQQRHRQALADAIAACEARHAEALDQRRRRDVALAASLRGAKQRAKGPQHVAACVEINQCVGCDNSSLSHVAAERARDSLAEAAAAVDVLYQQEAARIDRRPRRREGAYAAAPAAPAPSDAALPPPPPRRAPPPPPTRASTRARGRHGTPRPPPPPASRPRNHRVAAPLKLGAWNKTTRTEPMPFKHNYTVPGSDVAS